MVEHALINVFDDLADGMHHASRDSQLTEAETSSPQPCFVPTRPDRPPRPVLSIRVNKNITTTATYPQQTKPYTTELFFCNILINSLHTHIHT